MQPGEIERPSARSRRTTLQRDAPRDWRTAVSRCRATARDSMRFATFADTINTVSIVMTEKIARNVGAPEGITPPAVAA